MGAQMIEMFCSIGDVRHELQKQVAIPSVFTAASRQNRTDQKAKPKE